MTGAPQPGPVLHAMATMEGFFEPDTRPARNNDPLDLIYGQEAIEFGAIANQNGQSVFPDADTGWNAGRRWLSVPAHLLYNDEEYAAFPVPGRKLVGGYLNAQLVEIINRFAPGSQKGNNPQAYVSGVCALCPGVTPQTVITAELLG